jgi:hypothetical protein
LQAEDESRKKAEEEKQGEHTAMKAKDGAKEALCCHDNIGISRSTSTFLGRGYNTLIRLSNFLNLLAAVTSV